MKKVTAQRSPTFAPVAPPSRAALLLGSAWTAVAAISGCTAEWYETDADREVAALLAEYDQRTLGDRESWVLAPKPLAGEPEAGAMVKEDQDALDEAYSGEAMIIDLSHALELAFASSRDFKTAAEGLYLQGLGFSLTRYDFGPVLNSTISYLWNDAEDSTANDSLAANFGVRQTLPTGGELSVQSSLTGSRADDPRLFRFDDDTFYSSNVEISLRQPLLRGAGYEVSHEALTQGERNLIYAVRNFELFREDFAIRIAEAYYGLVSERQQLDNDEQDYRNAVFDREKAEALRALDRYQDEEVFLARRREIQSEDALLVSRTNYDKNLDDFKILLGLPTAARIEIVPAEPDFGPVRIDPDSAVEVAHHNRLDLQTDRDRLEDAERQVRLARNGLRPDLDLTLTGGYGGAEDDLRDAGPDEWSVAVGVTLALPVDRKAERNVYRSSLIALERSRRNLDRRLDEVERDVLDQLRTLDQLEKRMQLQTGQIEEGERAVAVTQIRVESGDVEARDLLDARQALVDAQNALIKLKVDHFTARLRLRRNLGVLFIDDKGMWSK